MDQLGAGPGVGLVVAAMNERRSEWATFAVLGVAVTVAWVWVCWIGRQVAELFS